MIKLLPLTLILWPFNIGAFNSQIVGFALFIVIVFFKASIKDLKFVEISLPATLGYFFLLVILFFSVFLGDENSEIIKFFYYIILIPVLFFLAFFYERTLHNYYHDNNDIVCIFYTAVPFVLFCALEVMFPAFHEFIDPYVTTEGARHVIESGLAGNSFRSLGWTGFLFADYSVALAFTALGILIFKKKPTLFSLFFEFSCVLLALVAGRSSLPIIIFYLVLSFGYRFNIIRFISLLLISFISVFYLLNKFGNNFFIWMLEPIYMYMEEGKLSSGSVNETNEQFKDFFASIRDSDFYNILGNGVYFSSNFSYGDLNIVAGDSGLTRIYHAAGVLGISCFLFMWASIFLKVMCSFFQINKYREDCKLFLMIFMMYGFLFFFKSEWLYQKFFIFISFYFYHKIYRKDSVLKLNKATI